MQRQYGGPYQQQSQYNAGGQYPQPNPYQQNPYANNNQYQNQNIAQNPYTGSQFGAMQNAMHGSYQPPMQNQQYTNRYQQRQNPYMSRARASYPQYNAQPYPNQQPQPQPYPNQQSPSNPSYQRPYYDNSTAIESTDAKEDRLALTLIVIAGLMSMLICIYMVGAYLSFGNINADNHEFYWLFANIVNLPYAVRLIILVAFIVSVLAMGVKLGKGYFVIALIVATVATVFAVLPKDTLVDLLNALYKSDIVDFVF